MNREGRARLDALVFVNVVGVVRFGRRLRHCGEGEESHGRDCSDVEAKLMFEAADGGRAPHE